LAASRKRALIICISCALCHTAGSTTAIFKTETSRKTYNIFNRALLNESDSVASNFLSDQLKKGNDSFNAQFLCIMKY
jgi:formate hydrogenlyase subunit 6/NADH:ubiquinone oxidoreductase subunit I